MTLAPSRARRIAAILLVAALALSALYRACAPPAPRLGGFGGIGAAPASAAASCVARGPHTAVIASNSGTLVYRVRTTTADTWWACRTGGGRRTRIGVDDRFQNGASEYGPSSVLTHLRLAGGWASVVHEAGADAYTACTKYVVYPCSGVTSTLVVIDARSGRRGALAKVDTQTTDDTGGGTQVDWLRTVLSPAGGVAWLLRRTTYSASGAATAGVPTLYGCLIRGTGTPKPPQTGGRRGTGVGCAPLTLAQEDVDPASLRVSGTTLSWTTGGQPRSASLASI